MLPRPQASPFTPDQIAHYRTHGWLAVPDFWSAPEVLALQREVVVLRERGLLRNVATEGDGATAARTAQNLQLCPAARHSPLLRSLSYAPKVTAAISSLIDGPLLLWLDQIFLKPARHGVGTNWHQDDAYFRAAKPTNGIGMWTAIHPATIANGTMHLAPRPGRLLDHQRDPSSDHHIICRIDEATAIPVELPAGGALFFAFDMPHCTKGNHTDADRAGLAYHFSSLDALTPEGLAKYRGEGHWYLHQLTGPGATDGTAAWGGSQIGVFDQLVEQAAR